MRWCEVFFVKIKKENKVTPKWKRVCHSPVWRPWSQRPPGRECSGTGQMCACPAGVSAGHLLRRTVYRSSHTHTGLTWWYSELWGAEATPPGIQSPPCCTVGRTGASAASPGVTLGGPENPQSWQIAGHTGCTGSPRCCPWRGWSPPPVCGVWGRRSLHRRRLGSVQQPLLDVCC